MRTVVSRAEVYQAIDSERAYQDEKWNSMTTDSNGDHSVYEWLVFLQDYLTEGIHQASRLPDQDSKPLVLDTVRKLASMCVAAMEQHGAPHRIMSRPYSTEP